MTPLLVGCLVIFGVLCFFVMALYKDNRATELLLVGRIAETIKRTAETGEITSTPSVPDVQLMQASVDSLNFHVEYSWPTDWPTPHGEHDLPLIRMFVGHIGPAPWMGYSELTFALSHGYGANDGHTPEDILSYTITGHTADGKPVSHEGTVTACQRELVAMVSALSLAIDAIAKRIRTSNPA